MEKIKAKLIKRKDIRDEFRKTPTYTDVGYILEGYFTEWPEVGLNFKFYEFSDKLHDYYLFTTTFIVEMIDHRTFRTKNSIYELITLVDERDEKINDLLK